MNGSGMGKVDFTRIQRLSFALGVVALAACTAGALADPTQFFRSYLVGYLYWVGIALGSLAIVMLHHLTGGRWGSAIRRLLESGTRTLPLMAVLLAPVLFGLPRLYEWARPEAMAHDELLRHKAPYLNVPFFLVRMAAYFAIWLALSYFLNKWSAEQDRASSPSLKSRLQTLSGPGLLLYGLTMTFASVDWVMSLEPHWYSTIYGIIFVVGQALATLAFCTVALALLMRRTSLAEFVKPSHFHDLGNLTLAFVMLWAYVAFSQFLIIWAGNLPEETPWYVRRLNGGWGWIAGFLIIFHFLLPFALLLVRENKRRIGVLAGLAAVVVVVRWVDLFWIIAPAFHQERLYIHWMDVAALAGIGGIWVAVFTWQLSRRPLEPLEALRAEGGVHG